MRPIRWELKQIKDGKTELLSSSSVLTGVTPENIASPRIKELIDKHLLQRNVPSTVSTQEKTLSCDPSAELVIDVILNVDAEGFEEAGKTLEESRSQVLEDLRYFPISVYVNGLKASYREKLLQDGKTLRLNFSSPLLSQCLHKGEIRVFGSNRSVDFFGCFTVAIDNASSFHENSARKTLSEMENFITERSAVFFAKGEKSTKKRKSPFDKEAGQEFERIIEVYKKYADYFRLNARFKVSTQMEEASFNRIRGFTATTMQYIHTHPDQLVPATGATGIPFRGAYYIPTKALVQSKVKNFDIPENRILTSFLKLVCKEIEDPKFQAVSSAVRKILHELLTLYESMFAFQSETMVKLPRPTSIISSVVPYREVYSEILNHFKAKEKEEKIKTFLNDAETKGRLYEYYCLLKILFACEEDGWKFEESKHIDWKLSSGFYQLAPFDNCFVFSQKGRKRTVYFEPVVHSASEELCATLGLYRSSNLKLDDTGKLVSTGMDNPVYTPDFVIKEEVGNRNAFTIADAKFTTKSKAIQERTVPFILKYVYGIKPVNSKDIVNNYLLLCGLNEGRDTSEFTLANPLTGEKESGANDVTVLVLNESTQ